ncbi:MAG: 5-dehydro-4-deoxy-D-glucuronate isomerase [Defluviitaleaceae bacterium]|nr:5-dehydro-4-deoxy-D-glucuronate isomerase [Defluviitaleaceae bacterium]
MKLNIRYGNHPEEIKTYNTEQLREKFLIEKVFTPDTLSFTYSHIDRIIVGGIMPIEKELSLVGGKETGSDTFFERREGGIINIGGPGVAVIDGSEYTLNNKDCLYIGKGVKNASFKSSDKANPAKFYFNSVPAHHPYPTKLITLENANKVHLGSDETSNKRTINQYIHPDVVDSCQLSMGMTILDTGSVWNTMPSHTHERRMEVYMYFDMEDKTKVIHLMGQPTETRHLVVGNEQAVISPSWSIHSGAGTGRYTFIWGMCGENITFTDMDFVDMDDLR